MEFGFNAPVKIAWSTLSVVDTIRIIRRSAGTLSPTEIHDRTINRRVRLCIFDSDTYVKRTMAPFENSRKY